MKKGWSIKNFDEVLEIRNGRNQREVESETGEFPIYGSAGNVMGMAADYICEAGTTIIGRKGNINSPIYTETRFWNVDTAFGLAAKAGLDSRYLYFFCLSYDFSTHNRGTTIPSLVKSELLQIAIPFPSPPEQKRIVAILDEVFAGIDKAIANTEKNLANARELFESHLNAVFDPSTRSGQGGDGWEEKKLGDVCTKIGSGATPRGGANSYKAEGISLIRSMNVHDRMFKRDKLAFIDDDQASKLANVVVETNDVLFNITGASIARCCVVPSGHIPARVNQHVSILRPTEAMLSSSFLCFLMTSKQYKDLLLGIGEAGSTRQAITKKQLQDLRIEIPSSLDIQACIASQLNAYLRETERFENICQQKLSALAELKQSVLQKAFSGELTANADAVLKEAV